MKSFIKILFLFVVLSFIFSMLIACGNTGATVDNTAAENKPAVVNDYPPAPEAIMQAELEKLDGTKFKLADYKGKVILVNLWATWCGPCIKEMPELVKLQDEHRDKGFEIIGLNLDEEDDVVKIEKFKKAQGLNYELAMGEHKLFGEFLKVSKFDAIPQSILIDREGRLNGVFVGGSTKILEKLKEAIGKTITQ